MRFGLDQYDPENYNPEPAPLPEPNWAEQRQAAFAQPEPAPTPPWESTWAEERAAAFTPAPDLAPDFVRQIPSAAIEEDHRQTQAEEWATNAQGWMADRWADVRGEELRLAAEEIVGNVGEFMTTPIENPLAEVPVVGGLVRRAPAREKPVSEWTEEDYSSLSGILNPPGIAKAPGLVAEGLAAGIGRPARNLPPLPAGFRIRTRADPAADVVVRDAKSPVTNEEISAIREWIAAIGGTQSSTGTRQGIWGYIPPEEAGEVLGGGLGRFGYKRARAVVDGLRVRPDIPDEASIADLVKGDYTIAPDVRQVQMADLIQGRKLATDQRTRDLAAEIQKSGEINPLIVAVDKDGPWPVEGWHRLDALRLLGKEEFPALVVYEAEALGPEVLGGGLGGLARRVTGLAKGGAEEIPPTARPIALTTEEEIARLRLDKFPEEVRGTILEAAQNVDWARTQRRGVIPDEAAQGMADDIVKTVDDWIRGGKAGKAYNQEELIALRNTVGSQANRVDEVTRAFTTAKEAGTNTDLQLIEMMGETDKLNALVTIAEGGRAEAGRAVRSFQQGLRLVDLKPEDAIARIVKKFGSRDKAFDAISEYQKMLDNGADVFQQARFWSRIEKPPTGLADWFKLVRYNSMLSGPRTAEVNTIGTAVEVPWRLARDFGASTIRGRPEELAPEVAGIFAGLQRGWKPFKDIIKHGVTTEQAAVGDVPASISARTTGPLSGVAAGLEFPGRVLRATDELMNQMAYGMNTGREAGKAASTAGIRTPKAWSEFVADFLENIEQHPEAMKRAGEAADRMTFRGDMGATGRWLDKGSQTVPGHIVMPFLRTLYHITSRGLERAPGVGPAMTVYELAKGTYGKGKELPAGVSPLGERVGNNAMGTVGGMWLVNQALQGNISAAGPDNKERRAALEAQGWQRNSIKVGDQWVSYANWGPFAVPLALAASVGEAGVYAKPDDDVKAKAIDAAVRFSKLTQEQTFLSGVGAIYRALEDPERYGAQALTQQIQSLIPYGSTLSTAAQAMETEGARQPTPGNIGEALQVRVPGLRQNVPLREDVLGEVMPDPYAGRLELPVIGETIPNAFLPVRRSEIEPDPMLMEMERLSAAGHPTSIGRLEADIKGAKLEPAEQKRLQQIYGAMVQVRLGRIINDGSYQRASPGEQSKILESNEHAVREQARGQLQREMPEIQTRIRAAERAAQERLRAR